MGGGEDSLKSPEGARLNLPLGKLVAGRYKVCGRLHDGSNAELLVVLDEHAVGGTSSEVVLKIHNPDLHGPVGPTLSLTLRHNFEREGAILRRLHARGIVRLLGDGVGSDLDGRPFRFLVLEYLPGGDLADLLQTRPLSTDEARLYIEQLSAALAYAHRQNVVHRDLKPENLYLTQDRRIIKLGDFGAAVLGDEPDDARRAQIGSPVYSAPEHNPSLTGSAKHEVTSRSDVYALGVLSLHMLAGRIPDNFTPGQQITSLPDALNGLACGADLLEVLRTATAFDPSERYASVEAFCVEFCAALARIPQTKGIRIPVVHKKPPITLPTTGPSGSAPRGTTAAAAGAHAGAPASATGPKFHGFALSALLTQIGTRLLANWLAWAIGGILGTVWALISLIHIYTLPPTPTPQPPATGQVATKGLIGRIGTASTDINVHARPMGKRIGLVERDSRVQIKTLRGNWAEIEIIEHGRPKEHPEYSDVGWIDTGYLNF